MPFLYTRGWTGNVCISKTSYVSDTEIPGVMIIYAVVYGTWTIFPITNALGSTSRCDDVLISPRLEQTPLRWGGSAEYLMKFRALIRALAEDCCDCGNKPGDYWQLPRRSTFVPWHHLCLIATSNISVKTSISRALHVSVMFNCTVIFNC